VRFLLALAVTLLIAPASASALNRPYIERVHGDTPCPVGGGTCASSPDIYLEPGATQFMLWHERAHLFDAQVLTDEDRAWFTRLLKMDGPWDQGTGTGTRGPSEVFADAYAACALGRVPVARKRGGMMIKQWTTSYGWDPGMRRHVRVCNAIAWRTLAAMRPGSAGTAG
jgi:hypothetical protein